MWATVIPRVSTESSKNPFLSSKTALNRPQMAAFFSHTARVGRIVNHQPLIRKRQSLGAETRILGICLYPESNNLCTLGTKWHKSLFGLGPNVNSCPYFETAGGDIRISCFTIGSILIRSYSERVQQSIRKPSVGMIEHGQP